MVLCTRRGLRQTIFNDERDQHLASAGWWACGIFGLVLVGGSRWMSSFIVFIWFSAGMRWGGCWWDVTTCPCWRDRVSHGLRIYLLVALVIWTTITKQFDTIDKKCGGGGRKKISSPKKKCASGMYFRFGKQIGRTHLKQLWPKIFFANARAQCAFLFRKILPGVRVTKDRSSLLCATGDATDAGLSCCNRFCNFSRSRLTNDKSSRLRTIWKMQAQKRMSEPWNDMNAPPTPARCGWWKQENLLLRASVSAAVLGERFECRLSFPQQLNCLWVSWILEWTI